MRYRRPEGFAANIRVRCRGDTDSPRVMPLRHKPGDVPANSTERSRSFDPAARYDPPQNPAGGRARPPQVPRPRVPRLTETPLPPPGTARSKATDGAGAGSTAPKAGPRGEAPAAPSILRFLLNFSLTAHTTGSKCCAPWQSGGAEERPGTAGARDETEPVKCSSKKSKQVTPALTAKCRIPLRNRTLK